MSNRTEYIELFWCCPECGKDHISAIPELNETGWYCPVCFFRRDEKVELYEASDSRVITDTELIRRIEEGRADWKCKHCGSLNEDEGLTTELLRCSVCGFYQTDINDDSAPVRDKSGEFVRKQTEIGDRWQNLIVSPSLPKQDDSYSQTGNRDGQTDRGRTFNWLPKFDLPWRKIWVGTAIFGSIIVVVVGSWKFFAPQNLEVEIKSLPWQVQVDVQQLRPVDKSGWEETVPLNARIIRTQNRQRGTREVQRGSKTIMVDERYQSGTKTETYTVQERYQSGTRQECTTTTTGTGAGKRVCKDVPVFSKRSVNKKREVPVYSTRRVAKTVPNIVQEPVYDTYVFYRVDEWQHLQTYTNSGYNDQPRITPTPKLNNSRYPERTLKPRTICQVTGRYEQKDKSKVTTWVLPCTEFDLLDKGDRVLLQVNRAGHASLQKVLSQTD